MQSLRKRLRLVRLGIGDQADYLQHLVNQHDLPYDASCTLQVAVHDLHQVAGRIGAVTDRLHKKGPSPRRKKRPRHPG